jgi:hypothetical protein
MVIMTKIVRFIDTTSFNHLMYANDMVLLSPSIVGLQHMLKICETFATESDMLLIPKNVYMCIQPKGFCIISIPKV